MVDFPPFASDYGVLGMGGLPVAGVLVVGGDGCGGGDVVRAYLAAGEAKDPYK